ncbi:MAG TPA: UrcA family protein [Steroidobacteraceae bacterium]|jgi:UrcA family protein
MPTASCLIQRCLYGLLASSTLVLLSAPLSAAHAAGDAPAIVVRYAARDLVSKANAQQLLRRIEMAAHQVCLDQNLEPLLLQAAAHRCYLSAVGRAVDSVNAPRVRAAYVAKYAPVTPAAEAKQNSARARQHIGHG